MRALAEHWHEDADMWGLAGLAHDIDAEQTQHDFALHGKNSAALLAGLGAPPHVVRAVTAHNPATGTSPDTRLEIALAAADQLTGLITAASLVRPDRQVANVAVKSIRKRFREGAFARGIDRVAIARCEELDLPLEEFMSIGLAAMQGIAADLGL
jgi:predicted hydrolase (HD superfamily)